MGDGNGLNPDSEAAVDRTTPSRASARETSGRLERILKFVGAATAVLRSVAQSTGWDISFMASCKTAAR